MTWLRQLYAWLTGRWHWCSARNGTWQPWTADACVLCAVWRRRFGRFWEWIRDAAVLEDCDCAKCADVRAQRSAPLPADVPVGPEDDVAVIAPRPKRPARTRKPPRRVTARKGRKP